MQPSAELCRDLQIMPLSAGSAGLDFANNLSSESKNTAIEQQSKTPVVAMSDKQEKLLLSGLTSASLGCFKPST